jgi:hypothetical protein
MVEHHKASVHGVELAPALNVVGMRVAPEAVVGLKKGDVVVQAKEIRTY